MKRTISIEGMACSHCAATVKKALEGLSGISLAQVDLERKEALVTIEGDVSEEELKKAVEKEDFIVTNIV